MGKLMKGNIEWVGKVDWELRKFHGNELSTHRGSTYNSYLIREKKTALIDTVWSPFAKEFVRGLSRDIDLKKIDFIVANHGEIDHSGALPELMARIPETPIYCTANCVKSLKGHYHEDWNFRPVKTGDRLDLGGKELLFIEAPMLHWPDSMFCYLTKDNVLFTNDAFGQHYATDLLFNDLVNPTELWEEALKYYANILTPFSPLVEKKIREFVSLDLPLEMILTSHGAVWRTNPVEIVEKYLAWAGSYRENQITILYDTMWSGTRVMAENIARGIREEDPQVRLKVSNLSLTDKNDAITEVFKSKALLVGCPTINRGLLSGTAGMLEEIRGLSMRGKKAAAFGCYGWSGESVKMISDILKAGGFELMDEGLPALWNPDEETIARCIAYGRKFAARLK